MLAHGVGIGDQGLLHDGPAILGDAGQHPAAVVGTGLPAHQAGRLEPADLAGHPAGQRQQLLGEVPHPGRPGFGAVQDLQQSHIHEAQLVLIGETPIQRSVQPQGSLEEVLPGPLFGDVQARHFTCCPPRNNPAHGLIVGDERPVQGPKLRTGSF